MIRYLFILLLAVYFWGIFYENVVLFFLSSKISVNDFRQLKNNTISHITFYDTRDAYVTMDINDYSRWGPFNFARASTYHLRTSSIDRFLGDMEKYYGKLSDNIVIDYREFSKIGFMDIFVIFVVWQLLHIIGGFLLSKKDGSFGDMIGKMTGTEKEFELVKDVKQKLEDVAGCTEVKEEVWEMVDMLKNASKYLNMGARLPKGCLFTGPPGTGKTLMAKAVAGECGFSFLSVSGSDFNEMLVGLGSARIRKLFKKARENRPCIIFIDEIDAVAHKRNDKHQQHDDKDNTLNALLVEMDGFSDNDGIMVFGATNRVEMLDPAIMRSGRFDRKVHFGLPDKNDRQSIFEYYFKDVKWDEVKSMEVSLEQIVPISYGLTGADISNLVNEACISAVRGGRELVNSGDIMGAYEYIVCGKEKKNYFMTEKERKAVAYHESGHALLGWIFKGCSLPTLVSIIPTGKSALGYTLRENEERKLKTVEEMLGEIGMMLGGRLAEEIFVGEVTTGASDDFRRAVEQAKSMVIDYNFFVDYYVLNEGCIGSDSKKRVDEIATRIVQDVYKIGRKEMEKYSTKIEEMVKLLEEQKKIDGGKIGEIFGEEIEDVVRLGVKDLGVVVLK